MLRMVVYFDLDGHFFSDRKSVSSNALSDIPVSLISKAIAAIVALPLVRRITFAPTG